MEKTVLVVEDDPRIAALIRDYFIKEYRVLQAENGAGALLEFESNRVDLVILDIMLPVLDGWEVCRNIRKRSNVPILVLTAKSDEDSSLKGYALGVDEYVTKPFSPKVLLAKARAIFKRYENQDLGIPGPLEIDQDFVIHEAAYSVQIKGKPAGLSTTEFSILVCLVKNRNIVLTRDNILDRVWGETYFGDSRIVDTNIKRIREKLGEKAKYIRTVRGIGYKFEIL